MKTILSIIFLSCALATNAQEVQVKAYSLEEMKAGFVSQYVNHEPAPSLTGYDEIWFDDQFYAAYEEKMDSLYPDQVKEMKAMKRILKSDPSLRVVNNKVLPPSIYLWIYVKDQEHGMLYWMGFKEGKDSIGQAELREWICKQFGTVVIENCTLVPAKWFSGQLKVIKSPRVYGNTLVSSRLFVADIVKGEIIESKFVAYREPRGEPGGRLIGDIIRIRDGMIYTFDGYWNAERLQQTALTLFARDVNRLCTMQKGIRPVEYSFLFFVDSEFKTHLHVLLPSQLDAEDEKRISELSNAIEAQPRAVFSRYWTIEAKRFSGIYVKAIFDGSGWHFSDYNYIGL